ncbi:tyrosine-protein kinase CSK [Gigaspora margarita]|uniref:Tyrosine-protein kinase CSK n=1 Tax=Gigaspora margarita TaxID=4874 RepID=A0A8H4EM56_GIGMA|nr:tyrosine-protein kinase CSK [Gigaspora margarita]
MNDENDFFILYDDIKLTGQKLGKGSASEVELGEYQGNKVAVKRFDNGDIKEIIKELRKHKNLRSEYIIKFCGVVRASNDNTYLVTKFAENGTLRDYLEKKEYEYFTKAKMAVDIANGLIEWHKNGIVHSDLKADNILVDKDLILKISDFGLSTSKKALSLGEQAGGAPKWRAPERFAYNSKPYEKYKDDSKFSKLFDEKMAKHYKDQPHLSDVYSYGLVVWEIATNGMVLYPGLKNVVSLLEIKIRDDINDLVEALDRKNVPPIFRYVIKKCCEFDPLKRIFLEQVIFDLKDMYKNIVWNGRGR